MEVYEVDMLDQSDFRQIKKDGQAGKKRKIQERPLDDSLTSNQKSAVESVTYAFPEISPSTIMTEALRVLDEASSAQRETSTMKGDFRRKIIVGVEVAKQAISGEGGELGQDSGASEDIEGTMSPA